MQIEAFMDLYYEAPNAEAGVEAQRVAGSNY